MDFIETLKQQVQCTKEIFYHCLFDNRLTSFNERPISLCTKLKSIGNFFIVISKDLSTHTV